MNRLYAIVTSVFLTVTLFASNVMAALPADVDTAISASQTDILAMIAKGFAYVGATTALMVVLAVFAKIIRKGKG